MFVKATVEIEEQKILVQLVNLFLNWTVVDRNNSW